MLIILTHVYLACRYDLWWSIFTVCYRFFYLSKGSEYFFLHWVDVDFSAGFSRSLKEVIWYFVVLVRNSKHQLLKNDYIWLCYIHTGTHTHTVSECNQSPTQQSRSCNSGTKLLLWLTSKETRKGILVLCLPHKWSCKHVAAAWTTGLHPFEVVPLLKDCD